MKVSIPTTTGLISRSGDGVAEAISIARRMVSELLANHEPIDDMIEITDATGALVAELPFHCCAQLQ